MERSPPDWTLIRSFLAVAEAGSLSAAARDTGISQPTLGRHIRQIEAELGAELFARGRRGLDLTAAGADLIAPAREMRAAAARLNLAAAARDTGLRGTVRITASHIVAHHILPAILAELRVAEPGIQIELVAADTSDNLLFREADIALRMYRPTQLGIVARHIADLPVGLFAARGYLDRMGRPATHDELLRHDILGFDRSPLIIDTLAAYGVNVGRDFFPVRCDDQNIYWNLVRAGCGIGASQLWIGDAEPLVERVAPFLDLPAMPVWLAAPEALRLVPRLRRVWDFLAERFRVPPLP
ncbi:MAG: LysR family transcriptional regulator [Rhodobacteraceae bacterium]|nr:LysR family transcriptional regulator [Paracoccaceae bacterium]